MYNIEELYKIYQEATKNILDREKRLREKYAYLYKVSELQDWINLDLLADVDDMDDPRWIPIHIVDNANAIILGVARNRGIPRLIIMERYVRDKIGWLNEYWDQLLERYGKKFIL